MDNLHDKWVAHLGSVKDEIGGYPICRAPSPMEASWVAQRLNLASKLEQMTYDFATGKTDGNEILEFVRNNIGY